MTVTRVFRNSVRYIRDREPVDAGTTNRPIRDLHGNVAAIRAVVESMQVGQAIILRDQTLESALVAGQPVYLDAARNTWRAARATLTTSGTDAGVWAFGPDSYVGGVVESKVGNRGAVAVSGKLQFKQDWVRRVFDGSYAPGPVYLSRNTAGKLSTGKELSVRVGTVSGPDQHGVYTLIISPSTREGITAHSHLCMKLVAAPAGVPNRAPEHYGDILIGETYAEGPYPGFRHKVMTPNVDSPGWLPASHPQFAGLPVPAGAKFGYNIKADRALAGVWPPSPAHFAKSAMVTVGGIIVDEATVVANEYGIWWMTDEYGKAPWSVNHRDYIEEDGMEYEPLDTSRELPALVPRLMLWFNSIAAQTESSFLTAVVSDGTIAVTQSPGGLVTLAAATGGIEQALAPVAVLPSPETDADIHAVQTVYVPVGTGAEPYGFNDIPFPDVGPGVLPCIEFTGAGAIAVYSVDVNRVPAQASRVKLAVRLRVANNNSDAGVSPTSLFHVILGVQKPTTTGSALPVDTSHTDVLPWATKNSELPMGGYTYVDIETEAKAFNVTPGDTVTIVVRSETNNDAYLLGTRLLVSTV